MAEGLYEVERVVSYEITSDHSGQREAHFLIKWKHFPVSENTWEPLEHVRDALAIIAPSLLVRVTSELAQTPSKTEAAVQVTLLRTRSGAASSLTGPSAAHAKARTVTSSRRVPCRGGEQPPLDTGPGHACNPEKDT
eukprot:m.198245 g.198245  ORF g.198245 m.198245 type:complete len:137 (-) comp10653_c0_seq14:1185-1595(-)